MFHCYYLRRTTTFSQVYFCKNFTTTSLHFQSLLKYTCNRCIQAWETLPITPDAVSLVIRHPSSNQYKDYLVVFLGSALWSPSFMCLIITGSIGDILEVYLGLAMVIYVFMFTVILCCTLSSLTFKYCKLNFSKSDLIYEAHYIVSIIMIYPNCTKLSSLLHISKEPP